MSRVTFANRLVRLDLAICQDGSQLSRACIDLRVGDEDHKAVTWQASPDDVRAINNLDRDIIAMQGGEIWFRTMHDCRAARRAAFMRLAGALGTYLCDEIEKAEGWADA